MGTCLAATVTRGKHRVAVGRGSWHLSALTGRAAPHTCAPSCPQPCPGCSAVGVTDPFLSWASGGGTERVLLQVPYERQSCDIRLQPLCRGPWPAPHESPFLRVILSLSSALNRPPFPYLWSTPHSLKEKNPGTQDLHPTWNVGDAKPPAALSHPPPGLA